MAITPAMEICAVIGAFIGIMTWTVGKYYQKKKEFGYENVDIFFDKKFLKSAISAGILAAVTVGGAYPQILANVSPGWSYLTTIVSSATFAFFMNMGGNIIMGPSVITEAARQKVLEKRASRLFELQLNKLSDNLRMTEGTHANGTYITNQNEWRVKKGESEEITRNNDDVIKTEPIKKVEFKEDKFSDDGVSTL